jgi:hypothetical protein
VRIVRVHADSKPDGLAKIKGKDAFACGTGSFKQCAAVLGPGVSSSKDCRMKLYKYRRLDKYSLDIIVRNCIYFASVEQFNDPFEGKILPTMRKNRDDADSVLQIVDRPEVRRSMEPYFKEHFLKASPENRDLASSMYEAYINGDLSLSSLVGAEDGTELMAVMDETIQAAIHELFRRYSICTFSSRNDHPLMFAHYSDDHKGFCIEIESDVVLAVHREVIRFDEVKYKDPYPSIELSPDCLIDRELMQEELKPVFFTKASYWGYEAEWRMIRRSAPGLLQLPKDSITGIIFGCRMPAEDRYLLLKILGDSPIRRYMAVLRDKSFALDIVPDD